MASRREIAWRLNNAHVHLGRALSRTNAATGLTAEQRSALAVVHFYGPLRMGALAAVERVSAPAMTWTVGALVRRGLVRTKRDPIDHRALLVSTTAVGAELVSAGRDARVQQLETGLGQLRPEMQTDVASALDALEQLAAILERSDSVALSLPSANQRGRRSRPRSNRRMLRLRNASIAKPH